MSFHSLSVYACEIPALLTYTRRRRWPEAAKVPRTGDADGCLDIWGRYIEKRRGLYVNNPVSGGESEKVIYSL